MATSPAATSSAALAESTLDLLRSLDLADDQRLSHSDHAYGLVRQGLTAIVKRLAPQCTAPQIDKIITWAMMEGCSLADALDYFTRLGEQETRRAEGRYVQAAARALLAQAHGGPGGEGGRHAEGWLRSLSPSCGG
ncbi:hypothetical protein [Nonomuraea salmonea]|uniref:hypothetical protein n=1 Tax=Nonomuraea salmonea TaxID=46181 RepID=UPI002FED65F7